MKVKPKWKITHVRNHLGDLLASEGGILRDDALSEAVRLVEMERETSKADIGGVIASFEAWLQASANGNRRVSEADMRSMLQQAGSLLVLTGTFGFDVLDAIAKSFCDLLSGMILKDMHAIEPVAVHIQAMRLFAPGVAALSDDEAGRIYGIGPHPRLSRLRTSAWCRTRRGVFLTQDVRVVEKGDEEIATLQVCLIFRQTV